MKIIPEKYEFHVGDIIAHPTSDVVAIRTRSGVWKHSNLDCVVRTFNDESAEYRLKHSWIYMGNRAETARDAMQQ